MKKIFLYIILLSCAGCNLSLQRVEKEINKEIIINPVEKVSLVVLGTIQDGGSPHIGCEKKCCKELFQNPDNNRKVVSLGVVDPDNNKSFLFEATPDFSTQIKLLKKYSDSSKETPDGIFVTHAHIGHYTGLMYLGREALGADSVPVYTMPKMKAYLEQNGPWSQLVSLKNIQLNQLEHNSAQELTNNISVTPFIVPHRDEYSETVGYKIIGPNKSALFIPDINKWSVWKESISEEIKKVDYAFVDATFYDGEEIPNRDISEIPHPFIIESMELFQPLAPVEKKKIYFIHFNHTNPLIDINSNQAQFVLKQGYNIAQIYDVIEL